MKLTFTEDESFTIVVLEGDVIGGPDATKLNNLVHELIGKEQNKIIVDLSKVKLMSSSGLGILIGALTSVRQSGGDLVLVNITEKIQNLLTMTKLSSIFKSFDSIEQSKAAFNA